MANRIDKSIQNTNSAPPQKQNEPHRLFGTRRCDRCGNGLCSSELVMRARELVFHVGCFSCTLCGAQLSTGDTAAIRGGRVLCAEHYDVDMLRYVAWRKKFFVFI